MLLLLSILCLVALIPLSVLAGSGGNWKQAWRALREYLFVMSLIVVPVLLLAGFEYLAKLIG